MKTKLNGVWFLIFFIYLSSEARASLPIDEEYSYKGMVAVVLNLAKEPVFGEQVENELVALLKNNPRFEFSDEGYARVKQLLKTVEIPNVSAPTKEKYGFLAPILPELFKNGVKALLVSEIEPRGEEYKLHFSIVVTANGDLISSQTATVENPKSLENFTTSTRNAFPDLMKKIPFDATILQRDGYLVVFDRGLNVFKQGTQVPAYTIEKHDGGQLVFEETGLIGITQVDQTMAFGKIMVERRPREIARMNKVRLSDAPIADIATLLNSHGERGPAAIFDNEFEITKGKIGYVDLNIGASLLTLSNTTSRGTDFSSSVAIPGVVLNSELWLTSKYFVSIGLKYGSGSFVNKPQGTSTDAVGTSLTDVRFQLGYRLNLAAPSRGPIIHFKIGYAKQSISIDSASEPLLFTSASYAGPMLSTGIRFGVSERVGVGLDIDTLLFPGLSETPVTTGTSKSNVSAWNFAVKGYYNYDKEIDFVGKIYFQRNGADFAGAKTRTESLTATSQTSKGVMVGMVYYY